MDQNKNYLQENDKHPKRDPSFVETVIPPIVLNIPTEPFERIERRVGEVAENINQSTRDLQKRQEEASSKVVKAEAINLPDGLEEVPAQIEKVQKTIEELPKFEKTEIDLDPVVEAVEKKVEEAIEKIEPTEVDFSPVVNALSQVLKVEFPLNEGNRPGKADPTFYLPVRLTDGKQFYKAIDHAIASMGGGSGDKISPATIGEVLNISTPADEWTEIVFDGEVIAFEVQCRTGADIYITNSQDGARYMTIKSGTAKSFTLRMTRGWWVKSSSGTVVTEVLGIR